MERERIIHCEEPTQNNPIDLNIWVLLPWCSYSKLLIIPEDRFILVHRNLCAMEWSGVEWRSRRRSRRLKRFMLYSLPRYWSVRHWVEWWSHS